MTPPSKPREEFQRCRVVVAVSCTHAGAGVVCLKCFHEAMNKAMDTAYLAGAEAMRERAASFIQAAPGNTYTLDCDHDFLAGEIRSLSPSALERERR